MNKILNEFLHRFTFERQLGIMVTLGIVLLALSSSLVGSWQSNERVRRNLIEQGQRITENLAHQSALALLYGSADNASEAANATLAFPGVVGVEIRDVNRHPLLTLGHISPGEFPPVADQSNPAQAAAVLDAESQNAWRFVAPVYTQPSAESPFNMQPTAPELLGHVLVVMSKAALAQATTDIFITNIATSFSFALLFLFLIHFLTNRMTRPLKQLSASMGRAKAGESEVRARLVGPKDISDMAHAFNSMMMVLEEREAALRVAAIAFEIEEGMIVTDRDEMIIRVNRVFTQLSSYSAEEAIGKNLGML
ncbi:MAG: HAMP domain-containing protein, partial [Gallionella sp.]